MTDLFSLSAYDYDLPKELIAQKAWEPADECKLLYCEVGKDGLRMKDLIFKGILGLLNENDVLFFNNSKVVKARITSRIAGLKTGFQDKKGNEEIIFKIIGKVGEERLCQNCEILFLKMVENNTFEALVRPGKKFKIGNRVKVIKGSKEYLFEVTDNTADGRIIKYLGVENIFEVLEEIGQMPLPPYIEYSPEKEKPYQPVQAKKSGSVAAPTASLHFTKELLAQLRQKGVDFLESTLHIGMGTFKPVDVENIKDFNIHEEMVELDFSIFRKLKLIHRLNKQLTAVGTTATRILETIPYLYKKIKLNYPDYYKLVKNGFFEQLTADIDETKVNEYLPEEISFNLDTINFETKLFIYPGFKFKLVDKLLTNFHLPKSSLLMLVAAFMGYENMKKAYQHAIENKYRFFSFGDAMYIQNTKFAKN